jgi:serine/threonine-protein kinase
MAELMYKIANEEAPDIRIVRPELPGRLAEAVAFSLGKKSETRYQDGDQFAADLRAVMAELSAGAASLPTREQTVAFPAGVHPAFEKTIAARAPLNAPAGHADTDLKP